ncbi:DivIVA domain-containing protein [Micromonospora sp. NPDC006431]|uniref:DivIVA domain-containing protein n=1 Tax=Micromonospora sp. NPDC006431 TaxID=3364235 RepID=UPI0036C09166
MRKPARTAAVLFGLGVGATVGPSLGPAAVWSGVTIAALGVALSLVGTTESDLAGDGLVDRDEDAGLAGDGTTTGTAVVAERRRRPALSGLGTRVEQILKLAEEQADDHRAKARLEAEGIVTAARREAEAILNRAHEQAAGITGTRRDLSPVPPTRAPSPEEDPSPHS